jgi:hypothetical protein
MKSITTAEEKSRVTEAIRAYLDAKAAEKAAEEESSKRQSELLKILDGDKEAEWDSGDGRKYALAATYGKTRRSLSKDLIEKVLKVTITDECYAISKPWDELRVTIIA